MRILFFIDIFLVFFIVFFGYHFYKFRNPYKLVMYVGKKGSGKSTMIMKIVCQCRRKGIPVYSNISMPGAYIFNAKNLGKFSIPPRSVICIDEASLLWDNRNFKSFSDDLKSYFRYQRQYRHTVYLFSQAFDIDLKLRNLTDELYIIHNLFNCFSISRRVEKRIDVLSAHDDGVGESRIVDDLRYSPIWMAPFGGMHITYLPKYTRYFKSFDPPVLPDQGYDYVPFTDLSGHVPIRDRLWQSVKGLLFSAGKKCTAPFTDFFEKKLK